MPTPEKNMYRRIYPLRVLGMGLGGAVAAVVLWERQASLTAWVVMAMLAFAWPHVAYLLARRSPDPYQAEVRNLLMDSAMAAAFVPLMHFNLLPSVLIITLTMVDKITTGIRGLWARAVPGMLAAGIVSALATGAQWAPTTSMLVVMACLPVMVLHTLSVSVVSYRLIRKTAQQNRLLDELRRIDTLTGLYARGYWQEQANAALQRHHATGEPACLLMLDIDHFKDINDQHGHTVGDEVIRALAHVVQGTVRANDCAGRYGGDEFAILLPGMHARDARAVAERIRAQSEGLRMRQLPDLRITSSIGVAAADRHHQSLRDWMNAADAAMYVAKNEGRNRVAAFAEPAAPAVH